MIGFVDDAPSLLTKDSIGLLFEVPAEDPWEVISAKREKQWSYGGRCTRIAEGVQCWRRLIM